MNSEAEHGFLSSAEVASNQDLLTEILLRVPAKSLLKFKCVSKQWLSLISNPQFCLFHTRFHQNPNPTATALIIRRDFSSTPAFQLLPLENDAIFSTTLLSMDFLGVGQLNLNQSCNGLLLCSSKSSFRSSKHASLPDYTVIRENGGRFRYFICNPTTKQYKALCFPDSFNADLLGLGLAFDPLKSPHYKIVSICKSDKDNQKYRINLYKSETDSWCMLGITFTPPDVLCFGYPVYCNGAVHWYSYDKTTVYFDVEKELLKEMPMPSGLDSSYIQYFGESKGHLHMVVAPAEIATKFSVLEMATDYSGWFVRYLVCLDSTRIGSPELALYYEDMFRTFKVLSVVRAEKEESTTVILLDGRVMIYNLSNGTSKELCDLRQCFEPISDCDWIDAFQYFEALAFV